MRTRRLGWLLVACVAATAHADQTKPSTEPRSDVKDGRPAKVEATPAHADEVKRPARPAKASPKRAEKALDAELLELTNDPLTGKADRIDGTEARGLVTFTFDDGPNPETTPAVIDALEKYDVPATFFIVTRRLHGKLGEKPREILARILAAGFLVASHSVTHIDLKRKASPKVFAAEIDQSIRTLAKAAERTIGMFRPPFGSFDGRGRAWLKKRGLTEVRWSVDTLDWQATNDERLRKKVLSMILKQEGGVVLMHDVKPITARVIGLVLDDLEAANCKRLADKQQPILPVSIHYFLRDKNKPRAIPEAVKKQTEAYRTALPGRCASRPKPVEPAKPDAAPAAKPSDVKPTRRP